MTMKNKAIQLVAFLLISNAAFAQSDTISSFFKKRDFGQYFLSDHYAPIFRLGIGTSLTGFEYDINSTLREPNKQFVFAEPVLGVQVPIYYYKNDNQRLSISFPFSFSLWLDFTETRTAPVINTDYRFALAEINYHRTTTNSKIRNWGIKFIPYFHESTHIGDELTLVRVQDSIPTTRINVSYETFEIAFQINDSFDEKIKNRSLKIGGRFLWNPKVGFYDVDTTEVSPNDITINLSKRWIEPYFQMQTQNPNSKLSTKRMMFMTSLDLSLRVRFGYPVFYKDPTSPLWQKAEFGEAYQLSTNFLMGWKIYDNNDEPTGMGAFIKIYTGINPHGQFRNIPLFPYLGLHITYEP